MHFDNLRIAVFAQPLMRPRYSRIILPTCMLREFLQSVASANSQPNRALPPPLYRNPS